MVVGLLCRWIEYKFMTVASDFNVSMSISLL